MIWTRLGDQSVGSTWIPMFSRLASPSESPDPLPHAVTARVAARNVASTGTKRFLFLVIISPINLDGST